jgi:hypothetical protein
MNHGLRYQCTSTRDGSDQLMVLAMKATAQEMASTGASASSRTGGFPEFSSNSWSVVQAMGAQGWIFC